MTEPILINEHSREDKELLIVIIGDKRYAEY